MKATDYIVNFFTKHGISHIFGYQGGMVTHLVDSISKNPKMQFIQTYHEQSASIAAEGYALESHNFGVAISTSGPGATNMITGIADAYFSSVPVIYITGQVNTYEYKYNKQVRQLGFQETDIVSMVKPICKYAVLVDNVKDLPFELEKAVFIATSGRKGPVVLDIPMNVQRSEITVIKHYVIPSASFCSSETKEQLRKAFESLICAKRPLILFGGGVRQSALAFELKSFLTKVNVPCVCSLMGKGIIDEYNSNFVGMIGSYGNRAANIVLSAAEEVLVLGSRLDLRQTGNRKADILKSVHFTHIDIDNDEIENCNLPNITHIEADIKDFFIIAGSFVLDKNDAGRSQDWLDFISDIKVKYNQEKEIERFCKNKMPYETVLNISKTASENALFCVDIGQNQMWVSQGMFFKEQQDFYTSGGLAPMGYALPASVGAAFANPNRSVIAITGDGGFQIALQSLLLISQYHLKVSVVVLNNKALGMISQFQTLYFNSNFAGTKKCGGYMVPDIKKLSESFHLSYTEALKDDVKAGTVYNLFMGESTAVVPKLEFDHPLYHMNPYLSEQEIKGLEKYMREKEKMLIPPPHAHKTTHNSIHGKSHTKGQKCKQTRCRCAFSLRRCA